MRALLGTLRPTVHKRMDYVMDMALKFDCYKIKTQMRVPNMHPAVQ
jgi:hypothetical protein